MSHDAKSFMKFALSLAVSALFMLLCVDFVCQRTDGQTRRKSAPIKSPAGSPTKPSSEPTPSSRRHVIVTLKSGEAIKGDFIGSTADALKIELAGNVLTIELSKVASIVFASELQNTSAPTPAPAVASPEPSPTPLLSPRVSSHPETDLVGKWAMKLIAQSGQSLPLTLKVSPIAGVITATLDFGVKQIFTSKISFENERFKISFTDYDGGQQQLLSFDGRVIDSKIEGSFTMTGTGGGAGSFTGSPLGPSSQAETTVGSLTIQVGIVYKMSGPQPVARATFYLLRKDLTDILIEAGLRPDKNMNIVQTFGFAARYQSLGNYAKFYQIASRAIQSNIVATVVTDFIGVAQFVSVPAGSYYLMGYTETRGGFALWNVLVGVTTGANSLVLDQNNAAIAL